VKKQNTWRNSLQVCIPYSSRFAEPSADSSNGEEKAKILTTRIIWKKSLSKQERHPVDNLLKKTVGIQ
jgi:hypothetical protein